MIISKVTSTSKKVLKLHLKVNAPGGGFENESAHKNKSTRNAALTVLVQRNKRFQPNVSARQCDSRRSRAQFKVRQAQIQIFTSSQSSQRACEQPHFH